MSSRARAFFSKRRLKRAALAAAVIILFGPVLLILPLRWIDPPITMMMLWRTIDRLQQNKTPAVPRRTIVDLDGISPDLRRAILAAEDDAFYLHHGFDLRQMERALADRKQGKRLRGASTISQQTAKNLFLWNGRSFIRKGLEGYFTIYLELLLPKDRILELYLNLVECADGIFGVETASLHYFKKHAGAMTETESARLATVLPNPRKRTPFGEYADQRAAQILDAMQHPTPVRKE